MIIFGSSGHAHEISFFVENYSILNKEAISLCVLEEAIGNFKSIPIVSESDLQARLTEEFKISNAIIAIGNGAVRRKIVGKFKKFDNLIFPNFLFGTNAIFLDIGSGNIFFPTSISTIDVIIGNHNHFNLKVSVSHNVEIGDYNTFSPNVTLAGGVKINNNVFLGIGASVIDTVSICSDVIIGAGAVVIDDISEPGTYVGIPARKIK